MREFKVGDKVKIPSEPDSRWDLWVPEMDETCGETSVVTTLNESGECLDTDFIDCIGLDNDCTYRSSYLLTEPYNQEKTMKAEDIDLEKDQVFNPPIEGFELRNGSTQWASRKLKAILTDEFGSTEFYDSQLEYFAYCRPIQAPQPKTRPMTHFELLKLDALFKSSVNGYHFSNWNNHRNVEEYVYCLRSDFNKAETLEDVVWKKLEVES